MIIYYAIYVYVLYSYYISYFVLYIYIYDSFRRSSAYVYLVNGYHLSKRAACAAPIKEGPGGDAHRPQTKYKGQRQAPSAAPSPKAPKALRVCLEAGGRASSRSPYQGRHEGQCRPEHDVLEGLFGLLEKQALCYAI